MIDPASVFRILRATSRYLLFSGFIASVYFAPIYCQQGYDHIPCGTRSTDSTPWYAVTDFGNSYRQSRSSDQVLYLPLTFHTLGDNEGDGHYSLPKIHETVCRLNEDFAPYDIQFFIKGNVNKVNRSRYYDHDNFGDGLRMMETYNLAKTINVYVTNTAPDAACGYWLADPDAIVVRKGCMGPHGHTLTHEVGHWLSLLHPFNGWEGKNYDPDEETPKFLKINGQDTLYVESVSGKNCRKAGDRICDTGPDYLSISWDCNEDNLSPQLQIDPFGAGFRSDATNFMSYSTDRCQLSFSPSQVEIMRTYAIVFRYVFLRSSDDYQSVTKDPVTNLRPSEKKKVAFQSIDLSWDPHPGATHYLVQISRFPFFPTVDLEFVVNETQVNIGDLEVDRRYYWRIKPFNDFDVCAPFTFSLDGFETVQSVGVHQLGPNNQIEIFPTLISPQSEEIQMHLQISDIRELRIGLFDVFGKLHFSARYHGSEEFIPISTQQLLPGSYFLQILTEKGSFIQKFVKQ